MTESRIYDGLNRLTERKSVAGASTVADYDYTYNLANQRTRIDIGGTSPSYLSIDYDNLGQVTNAVKYWASDSLPVVGQQFGYQFNDIGNRKSTVRDGRVAEYANNNVNQITGRTVPGYLNLIGEADSASAVKVNGKTAERKGTYYRKELQVPNAAPLWLGITNVAIKPNASEENYVTNLGSVYVAPANESFTYDGDGNLTSDGLWNYTWDGENRLLKVESRMTIAPAARYKVEWVYDALGRRVSETTYNWNIGTGAYALNSTVLYVYDGWECIGELNTSKAVQRTYAWGLDLSGTRTGAGGVGGLLMINSTTAGTHYYSYDGNGNVVNLVAATDGSETARYEYDSFGIILRATGTMAAVNPYRFSTKRQESRTDVILYEYRPYSSSLGRWLSRDPIEEAGGLNLYGIGGNDSLNRIDFLGLADTSEAFAFDGKHPKGIYSNKCDKKYCCEDNLRRLRMHAITAITRRSIDFTMYWWIYGTKKTWNNHRTKYIEYWDMAKDCVQILAQQIADNQCIPNPPELKYYYDLKPKVMLLDDPKPFDQQFQWKPQPELSFADKTLIKVPGSDLAWIEYGAGGALAVSLPLAVAGTGGAALTVTAPAAGGSTGLGFLFPALAW